LVRRPGCAGELEEELEVKLVGWGVWEEGAVTFAKI